MGGIIGITLKKDCVQHLFYSVDYHSHLGTKNGGMAVYGQNGFKRVIHNISNSPFRTKFENDLAKMSGNIGIGCISDNEPQPLLLHSHLGSYAIVTVGLVSNKDQLVKELLGKGKTQFLEMSGGEVNQTELIASLINEKGSIVEGLSYVQAKVEGSISVMVMDDSGIYCSRDKYGRTPIIVGKSADGYCAVFESFSYLNLGYTLEKELGPGEIVYMTSEGIETKMPAKDEMRICTFLWIYYGYSNATYEGVNVEAMRYRCGSMLAKRDNVKPDLVAGVPDSGVAHAIGYSNESKVQFSRPFIKYTPTWPRSFMPQVQTDRNLIAKMKLVPIPELIKDKSLLLIDDSIVRGTQLGETTEFLYKSGAKEVHVRPACPPIMFGCKYLNFSRSTSEMDLITRRVIEKLEGGQYHLDEYVNPDSDKYKRMIEEIRKELNFTSLRYHRLDDMIEATGLEPCKLCTYCWDGKE